MKTGVTLGNSGFCVARLPRRKEVSMTRSKGIDLVKTVAILCVLFIHAGSVFYAFPVGSSAWNTLLVYGSAVRAGVPLFLMCSGALLLDPAKKLSVKRLYTHNLPRIVVAMLFWGMAYKIWHLYEQNSLSAPTVWNSFTEVLFFNQEFHFYYLHIILLVYILLPVTRVLVANASKAVLQYALAVWFALGILYPTVNGFWPFTLFSGMIPQYLIQMTYASVGYGVLGWYLKTYPLPKFSGFLLAPLGFCTIYFGTYVQSVRAGVLNELLFSGMTVGTYLFATGIYSLGMTYGDRMGKVFSAVTLYISKASFCLYLSHMFGLYLLQRHGFTVRNPLCDVPATVGLVFAGGIALYAVLSHIPVVRKWLV